MVRMTFALCEPRIRGVSVGQQITAGSPICLPRVLLDGDCDIHIHIKFKTRFKNSKSKQ